MFRLHLSEKGWGSKRITCFFLKTCFRLKGLRSWIRAGYERWTGPWRETGYLLEVEQDLERCYEKIE